MLCFFKLYHLSFSFFYKPQQNHSALVLHILIANFLSVCCFLLLGVNTFTFEDVNTLCVRRVFVWVIGRSKEPSFWFFHPRSTLTCRLHSGIVFHLRQNKQSINNVLLRSNRDDLVTGVTCIWILFCCPRQPKYEQTCNNCEHQKDRIRFYIVLLVKGLSQHSFGYRHWYVSRSAC